MAGQGLTARRFTEEKELPAPCGITTIGTTTWKEN
jgi:hypothetical protein